RFDLQLRLDQADGQPGLGIGLVGQGQVGVALLVGAGMLSGDSRAQVVQQGRIAAIGVLEQQLFGIAAATFRQSQQAADQMCAGPVLAPPDLPAPDAVRDADQAAQDDEQRVQRGQTGNHDQHEQQHAGLQRPLAQADDHQAAQPVQPERGVDAQQEDQEGGDQLTHDVLSTG